MSSVRSSVWSCIHRLHQAASPASPHPAGRIERVQVRCRLGRSKVGGCEREGEGLVAAG